MSHFKNTVWTHFDAGEENLDKHPHMCRIAGTLEWTSLRKICHIIEIYSHNNMNNFGRGSRCKFYLADTSLNHFNWYFNSL